MTLKTIAILSPGDMGHGVGKALSEHGYDVITCLAGRSQRTKDLAAAGGFRDTPSLDEMVSQADLIMSILVPAEAMGVARSVANALSSTGLSRPFADCNAVSPQTARRMESMINGAGGEYIDGGIIGGSPARGAIPRIYTSGPSAGVMDELDGKGIAVRNLGPEIGRASGIKMCYASMTKGTSALRVAMLTVTPHFHQGAAEIFRLLASTPFAHESPETIDRDRSLKDTISVTSEYLPTLMQSAD